MPDIFDDLLLHGVKSMQTQHAIIKYIEAMAQALAEAGRASHKATGDSAKEAARKWIAVLMDRTMEILENEPESKQAAWLKTEFETHKQRIEADKNGTMRRKRLERFDGNS